DAEARDRLMLRLRARVAQGLAPEALVRVTQFVFGPPVPYPVAFRVMGLDVDRLRRIADQVTAVMRANPNMRQVTQDWGPRAPTSLHRLRNPSGRFKHIFPSAIVSRWPGSLRSPLRPMSRWQRFFPRCSF